MGGRTPYRHERWSMALNNLSRKVSESPRVSLGYHSVPACKLLLASEIVLKLLETRRSGFSPVRQESGLSPIPRNVVVLENTGRAGGYTTLGVLLFDDVEAGRAVHSVRCGFWVCCVRHVRGKIPHFEVCRAAPSRVSRIHSDLDLFAVFAAASISATSDGSNRQNSRSPREEPLGSGGLPGLRLLLICKSLLYAQKMLAYGLAIL